MRVYQFRHVGTAFTSACWEADQHLHSTFQVISHQGDAKEQDYSVTPREVKLILRQNFARRSALGKQHGPPLHYLCINQQ